MRRSWIIAAVAVVAALAIGLTQLQGTGSTGGGKAPTLSAAQKDLAGSPPVLDAVHHQANATLPLGQFDAQLKALHGYPIVVNVWGSWCPPCRAEFPIFERVSAELGRKVAFLGVATEDQQSETAKFLASHPVTYPTYMDYQGKQRARYGLLSTPSTIIYDRAGHKFLHQGPYRSDADLKRDIRRYGA